LIHNETELLQMTYKIEVLKTLVLLIASGMSLDDATVEIRKCFFLGSNDIEQVLTAYHASILAGLKRDRAAIEDLKRRAEQSKDLPLFLRPQAE